ncbi:hypothetical protein RND71_007554 [Anisodus tanguticus]|uniref:Telomerase reverse transcriptase n=1 Tax=Anisodus tanguticus TaxID=243964 RepID=A0AAE1SM43_9SOLA|nr:hypothetical protein RND71_007554 [Anisodus tanguticus]
MKKRRVPEVLWRLFHNRARTLGDTILSLIPLKTSPNCSCKGRRCLGCVGEDGATSFLLREKDPDDYRKLLNHCFVVVSDHAPPLRTYDPHCRWPHLEPFPSSFADPGSIKPASSIHFIYIADLTWTEMLMLIISRLPKMLTQRLLLLRELIGGARRAEMEI